MATEKIEIDIIAKGKPAEKAIKGVDTQTKKLGTTTKETGKTIDKSVNGMRESWAGLGAKIAAVTVVLGASVAKAKEFERSAVGLTNAQKDWAKQTSLATDITAAQVAGFLKSAQTAGLAEDSMKNLAKQAIALGHAFPHEDAETLHDNLVMLNTTGEAQGFIVDILEQKLSSMGIAFEDMDLKALSAADKLKLIGEVAETSQKQLDTSPYTDLNTAMGTMSNTLTNLGDKLVKMGSDSGTFAALTATVEVFSAVVLLAADRLGKLVNWGKELIGITNEQSEQSKKEAAILEKINDERKTGIDLIKEMEERRNKNVQALEKAKESGASKEIIKWLEKEQRSLDKTIQKHKERLNVALGGSKNRKFGAVTASGSHIMTDALTEEEAQRLTKAMEKTADATKKSKDEFDSLSDSGRAVASGLTDAFTSFAMGAKLSFKDMARSIIADLVRIQIRKNITGFVNNFDLFGGTPAAAPTVHTGGSIGMASIPSFHNGYRSDERLAKLQVGESVVNRAGTAMNGDLIDAMNAGQKIGGGDNIQNANITFQVQAFDSASFQQGMVQNRATIVGVVRSAFNRNGKSVAL